MFNGTIKQFIKQECLGYQVTNNSIKSVIRHECDTNEGRMTLYSIEYVSGTKYFTERPRIDKWNK